MLHAQSPAHDYACTGAPWRARSRTAGFTLIEIIVVLIIISIIAAIAIPTFLGSKDSTRQNGVKTVAGAYSQGVAAYMLDNGNQLPSSLASNKLKDLNNKAYVRPADTVKQGYVVISGSGTAKTYGRLAYSGKGLNYEIKVYFRKSGGKPWKVVCSYGVPSGGAKLC